MKISNGTDTYEIPDEDFEQAKSQGYYRVLKVGNGTDEFEIPEQDLADAESKGFKNLDDISGVDSATSGVVQGATMGLSDEIRGGYNAVGNAIKDLVQDGDTSMERFKDAYKRGRDTSRSENKIHQQANPKSYLGGEIGGGLVAGSKIPITSLTKGANAGQRIAKGMALGQGIGGVEAFGRSEKQGQELAEDVQKGSNTGGLLGGGTQAAQEVVGGIRNMIVSDKSRSLQRDLGRKGVNTADTNIKEGAVKRVEDLTNDIQSQLDTDFGSSSEWYKKIKEANKDVLIDYTDTIQKNVDDLTKLVKGTKDAELKMAYAKKLSEQKAMLNGIRNKKGQFIQPSSVKKPWTVDEAMDYESAVSGKLKGTDRSIMVEKKANKIIADNAARKNENALPGLKETNEKFRKMRTLQEDGLVKGEDLPSSLRTSINNLSEDTISGANARGNFNKVKQAIQDYDPALAQKLENEAMDSSRTLRGIKEVQQGSKLSKWPLMFENYRGRTPLLDKIINKINNMAVSPERKVIILESILAPNRNKEEK